MTLRRLIVCFLLLLATLTAYGQYSCTYHLPYVQDFNNGFTYQTPHASSAVEMTLVTTDNCWTQYIYRSSYTIRPMISLNHTSSGDHALWLFAHHPMVGQPDRVSYTYIVSPAFHELPTVISFDVQYQWFDPTGNFGVPDGLPWHAGILQLGYVTDELDPAGNYFPIENIVIDTAAWSSGNTTNTDHWQHYHLDMRTRYSTLPTIRRLAFKPNCNMDSLNFVQIFIDNLRVADEMDTVEYHDTVCPGHPYSGYGFSIDSTETTTAGLHSFSRETMETHGMVHYRLFLYVPDAIVNVYASIDLGDTLPFADTLLATAGTYQFFYGSTIGCDSLIVLHLDVITPPVPDTLPPDGFWFPNVFTPGLDDNNRFGCITAAEVSEFEMWIYNRMGLLVWRSDDINQPWDGTRHGRPVPQGTYVYYYRLRTAADNHVHTGAGSITLLR